MSKNKKHDWKIGEHKSEGSVVPNLYIDLEDKRIRGERANDLIIDEAASLPDGITEETIESFKPIKIGNPHNVNVNLPDPKEKDLPSGGQIKKDNFILNVPVSKDMQDFIDQAWLPQHFDKEVWDIAKSFVHPLAGKKVLVTGGHGFLGSHIVDILNNVGALPIAEHRNFYDLTSQEQTRALFITHRPEYVIHCAGHNGGIEFNRKYPAEILDKNMRMALNVHKSSHEFHVEKVLSIVTSCAYPDVDGVLKEHTLWEGLPNYTIRGHGLAKRMLQACAEQYNKQYGLNAVCAAVTNLYGPGDTFNLTRTKVVGAVIRKVVEAHQFNNPVEFWGTGAPLRQFMYVVDAANAIVEALVKYDDPTKPLNIGVHSEFTIKELVKEVISCVGYDGVVTWDKSKGDGQMRKMLDVEHMKEILDVEITCFADGIRQTVEWYIANKKLADGRA